jgi:hypothetical protein
VTKCARFVTSHDRLRHNPVTKSHEPIRAAYRRRSPADIDIATKGSVMRIARSVPLFATLVAALAALALLAPRADAASYWATLDTARGEIAPGVSSFTVHSHGGPWLSYGNHCQADPGTYVAGAYCIIRFNVPPGLSAGAIGNGGIARGDYRTANPYAILRSERPGGNPAGVTDSSGDGAFNHGWQALGPYVDVSMRFTAATTTTAATNWFHVNTFDVVLHDPSVPTVTHVHAGGGGWNGPGCLPHSYGWADSGSQVAAMSITNLTTGAHVDGWSVPATGVTTGHASATDTGCTPAPGTGTFAFRTSASDRAGNGSHHDYALSFDTTPPTIGAPELDGAALADDAVIDPRHGYRPSVRWHGVGDAHSGLRSVTATLAGAPVPHVHVGSTVTLAPAAHLPLGTHDLRLTVVDNVGNTSIVSRRIVVRDDQAPTITVASPDATGGSEPVLDVAATDDHAGPAPATWTVKVNGATLVAGSSTGRLQADVGYLVDGEHELVVSIADHAGNVATETIAYRADSGDGLPDPPGLTGLYVMQSPDRVEEGTTHRIRAIAVRAGRPVEGRFELRAGPLPIAVDDSDRSGALDLEVAISSEGPLVLHPPTGSGLVPVELRYVFVPTPVDPCVARPLAPECVGDVTAGSGGGGGAVQPPVQQGPPAPTNTTTIINVPVPAATGGGAAPDAANGPGGYPRDVVYYVAGVPYWNGLPLAESGAPLDKVPPTWRMSLLRERAGVVRRTGRIALRLWTSEMTVLSLTPTGAVRRISVNPRRKLRTIHVRIDRRSVLGRRIQATRPGGTVVVRLRVVATDKNENATAPRMMTFRVRV